MELVKYNEACRAIAEAKNIDEVKTIRDKSEAIRAYAHIAKNKQMEIDATEIRIRSERRLGEMLKEQKETVGLAQGRRTDLVPERNQVEQRPTLAEVGIDKKLSSRAQAIAAVPVDEFEGMVDEWRERVKEEGERVTTNLVTRGEIEKNVHVSNNSGQNEWYTPANIIEAARAAMGSIDFDPASSEIANRTVKADTFCTIDDSGLDKEWTGNVWMNPPYAQPLISQFAERLVSQRDNYTQAIVLVNNATETEWFKNIISVASGVCFTKGRIKFIDMDGKPGGAPLQGQAIIYIGPYYSIFRSSFKEFGWIAKIEA